MPSGNVTEHNEPLAEETDYLVEGSVVGPDGVTPVEPAAISTVTATLRDLETGELIGDADQDVTDAVLDGGEFLMDLTNDQTISTVAKRFQKRLLTLKITQTNGKQRKQAVRFVVENLTDV